MNLRNTFRAAVMVAAMQFSLCTTQGFAAMLSPGDILVVDSGEGLGGATIPVMGAVFKIDPSTGDRVVVSGRGVGVGPDLLVPVGMTLSSSGQLFVADQSIDQQSGDLDVIIYRVDPTTGDRTEVSGPSVGTGPAFNPGSFVGPSGMVISPDGDLFLTVFWSTFIQGPSRIFRVDPFTGNRTVVSGDGIGNGPEFSRAIGIAIDENGDLIVTDSIEDRVVRVDPISGNRSVISDGAIDDPGVVGILPDGQLIVPGIDENTLYQIDPQSGVETMISASAPGGAIGSGPDLLTPFGVAPEEDGQILVTSLVPGNPSLLRIDPATGDRLLVSSQTTGVGPDFVTPSFITVVPVPEPASIVLFLCGLIGLTAWNTARRFDT